MSWGETLMRFRLPDFVHEDLNPQRAVPDPRSDTADTARSALHDGRRQAPSHCSHMMSGHMINWQGYWRCSQCGRKLVFAAVMDQ